MNEEFKTTAASDFPSDFVQISQDDFLPRLLKQTQLFQQASTSPLSSSKNTSFENDLWNQIGAIQVFQKRGGQMLSGYYSFCK